MKYRIPVRLTSLTLIDITLRGSNPRPGESTQRDPTLFPTITLTGFEVELLIPAPVGVAAAVKLT